MNFWSAMSSGFLSDSEMIHRTGIRQYTRTTVSAMLQSATSLPVLH